MEHHSIRKLGLGKSNFNFRAKNLKDSWEKWAFFVKEENVLEVVWKFKLPTLARIMGCLQSGRKILIWNCLHKLFYNFTTLPLRSRSKYACCCCSWRLNLSRWDIFCASSLLLCLHFLKTVKSTFITLSEFSFASKLTRQCEKMSAFGRTETFQLKTAWSKKESISYFSRLILNSSFSAQFGKIVNKNKLWKICNCKKARPEKLIVGENSPNDNVTQQKRRMRRSIQTISGWKHFHFCTQHDGT